MLFSRGFTPGNKQKSNLFQQLGHILRSKAVNRVTELTFHGECLVLIHDLRQLFPTQADQGCRHPVTGAVALVADRSGLHKHHADIAADTSP